MLKDVEMIRDNAVLIGREDTETRGVRIGTARDPSTTLGRRPADAAPGEQSTPGAAFSSA